jgi:hypothetical protein
LVERVEPGLFTKPGLCFKSFNERLVMSTEQEILTKLSDAERDYKEACDRLVECKKKWTEAETLVIETKLQRDRIKESLRVHRNTTVKYEQTPEEADVERFRKLLPELMKKI